MKSSNEGRGPITGRKPDVAEYLCMPCAVSEEDFRERTSKNSNPWDGPDEPRAWIRGREYTLVYHPAAHKITCMRCGEETHWAYHAEKTHEQGTVPLRIPAGTEAWAVSRGYRPAAADREGAAILRTHATRLILLLREVLFDAALVQSRTDDGYFRTIGAVPEFPDVPAKTIEDAIRAVRQAAETLREFVRRMEDQSSGPTVKTPDIGEAA